MTSSYTYRRRMLELGMMLLLVAACAVVALLFGGCAARVKTVTNLPAGVTQAEAQAWDSEVAALHKMAVVTSSVRQSIIGVENAGAFPDTVAYVAALRSIAKVDQLELASSDILKKSPQHFGLPEKQEVAGLLNDIANELQTLNVQSMAQVKNSNSKTQLTALLTDLQAALALALSLAQ